MRILIIIFAILALSVVFSCDKNPQSREDDTSAPEQEASIKQTTKAIIPIAETQIRTQNNAARAHAEITENLVVEAVPDEKLWDTYTKLRILSEEYVRVKNQEGAIEALVMAGKCAERLQRPDVASWQYNNAGKHGIDLFREAAQWDKRMIKLAQMRYGPEKRAFRKETKDAMAAYMDILEQSRSYLKLADSCNRKKFDPERAKVINNNKGFIAEIEGFVGG